MTTWKLLTTEMLHRKTHFAMSLCAILLAATLFVAGPTLMDGYRAESTSRLDQLQVETDQQLAAMQEKAKQDLAHLDKRTKRIMRDLGFNLRIVHRNTDLSQLYANFVSFDMDEDYVRRLADAPEITKIVHLVATLKQMIQWNDQPRLLIGFAPEATQSHIEQKSPMGFQIKEGTVFLGSEAGKGHQVGETIEIQGHRFEVARILEPHGRPEEDIAIAMHLRDAQKVLDKPGKISEIVALGCKCKTVERIEEIRAQLEAVLPEAKVMEHRINADAREQQRQLVTQHNAQLMEDYRQNREAVVTQVKNDQQRVLGMLGNVTGILTPLVVLVSVAWVGLLAWANVRERRTEIGLLRAIGKGSGSIAALILGKAMLLGLLGGVLGCAIGLGLARWLSLQLLAVDGSHFSPSWLAILGAVLGAPLLAAMASYLPTLRAITQDPATVLMES